MAAPVIQFKRGLLTNLPGLRAGEPGFTTDAYDLYVGIDSTTSNNQFVGSGRYWQVNTATVGSGVKLVEGTNNGTNAVTIKSPDSLAASYTLTMPADDGNANDVLVSDGSGGLSFSAPAASSFTLAADSGANDTFSTGGTLTFAGTANEIETTVSNDQIQIGLPDDVTVAGVLTVNGNTVLGNGFASDTLDINAAITSHLAPSNSNTYDLGMDPGTKWRNLYLDGKVSAGGSITAASFQTSGSLRFGSSTAVSSVLDEDNMASDSATALATQQSIKAYVDTTVGAINTDLVNDTTPQLGGTLDTNGNLVQFGDSGSATDDRLQFGDDQDLQIYHDSSNSYLTNSTGILLVRSDNFYVQSGTGTKNSARFHTGAQVDLRYNGSTKFETTNDGVVVTGISTAGTFAGYDLLEAPHSATTKTITVTVATKTAAHRYNGSGSSSGYLLDGVESPVLTLTPGRTYKFDQADSSNSGHPLLFYLESDKTTNYTTNVTTTGTPGSSGAHTTIVVGDETPSVLHYQCSAHSLMGNAVTTPSNVVNSNYDATLRGNLTLGTSTAVNAVLDEDNLASDSATSLATQQSIKAYVDSTVGAVDLTTSTAGDSGTGSFSTSQTLTVAGTANEVETSASGQTITVGLPAAVSVTTSVTTPTVKASSVQANDGTSAITITDSTGAVAMAQNLTVQGNLIVNGSTTQVNTSQTTIEDQLLELGMVDGSAPTSDLNKDIGVIFNYYTSSAKKAAVYWDDSTSRIVVSQDVSESSGVLTSATGGALEVASLYVNGCTGAAEEVIGCDSGTIVITNATIDGGSF